MLYLQLLTLVTLLLFGRKIMAKIDDLKTEFANVIREGNETITASLDRIAELIAGQEDPELQAEIDSLTEQARAAVKVQDDYQKSLKPQPPV